MNLKTATRLFSLLFLSSFMALLINADNYTAYAQSTHTLTINNNCSDTIWVGATPKVQSVTIPGKTITTLGGWEMMPGDTATVQVPLNYNSGRFWARTGCSFNSSGGCDPMMAYSARSQTAAIPAGAQMPAGILCWTVLIQDCPLQHLQR